eukprot:7965399-Alexandrium_andersonii.AAC.1
MPYCIAQAGLRNCSTRVCACALPWCVGLGSFWLDRTIGSAWTLGALADVSAPVRMRSDGARPR